MRFRADPVDLISLACRYRIDGWIEPMFRRLVDTPLQDISLAKARKLPLEIIYGLMQVHAAVGEHYRLIAAEPPPLVHGENCPSNKRCADDWYATWWNGMGRFLLDARHPLGWKEAVRRLEHLQFGGMGKDCLEMALKVVREGHAFLLADQLVRETGIKLSTILILQH
jgi:hypothetical protein